MEQELQRLDSLKESLLVYLATNGLQLLIAVGVVLLGFWLSKRISEWVLRFCDKRKIDLTLARFFAGAARLLIIVFALILGLSKAGIEITPFVALVGAGAFGLSLAVQGPVSNYGAGIVLIITRPFTVGDTLTVSGQSGLVDRVNLGNTELLNEDEERITIPNRKVLGEIFVNSNAYRVVEGIVGIDAFADSSINIGYRVWVPTNRYHRQRYALNLAVYHALKQANINIPFPQRDVRLIGNAASSETQK
jgi:small conductance mechanosensitive channel